ncbi:hypothetical protein CYMTET_21239, partial [Cymbomonas tetramitiformis]
MADLAENFKKRARLLKRQLSILVSRTQKKTLICTTAAVTFLQIFLVLSYLGLLEIKVSGGGEPGGGHVVFTTSLGNEKVEKETDVWKRYYARDEAVPWPDFLTHLLVNQATEVEDLPGKVQAKMGHLFDPNKDGKVSKKEFQRCLQKHGEIGLLATLQKVVNESIGKAVHTRQASIHPK